MLAEAQRAAMLRTMGIEAYRLRAAPAAAATAPARTRVAVICPTGAVPARFRAQLPRALGVAEDRVQWCDADRPAPGDATAYIAIGTEAARALGVQLSTMQQNSSIIATTAGPDALLRDGAARRALWQILKPVARRLLGIGGIL